MSDIKGIDRDASPIFLALLKFIHGRTSHDCYYGFMHTDLWKDIAQGKYRTYEELERTLINIIIEYNRINRELKNYKNNEGIEILLNFSYYDAGIKKSIEKINSYKIQGIEGFKSINTRIVLFEVGCAVKPSDIKKFINRKLYNNEKAEITSTKNTYAKIDEKNIPRIIKEIDSKDRVKKDGEINVHN